MAPDQVSHGQPLFGTAIVFGYGSGWARPLKPLEPPLGALAHHSASTACAAGYWTGTHLLALRRLNPHILTKAHVHVVDADATLDQCCVGIATPTRMGQN